MREIEKPGSSEHVPYVLQYFNLVPSDGRVLEHLRENLIETSAFLRALPSDLLDHRYAPGKWTIKEILQHLSDDERIYAYRALRFARGDTTELPGFDQDAYTAETQANLRALDDLIDEFATVRAATLSLYAGLGDAALLRSGVASGNIMSVRAIAYHVAGHELWHMKVIRERYLAP
ncbi:MAG TPA: DinB family protein [Geothrix sp.]|uniref:DinB family protein n=1 Tax=Geothrix mesophila TaxID=2922723 RepID=UPI001FABF455|nr:DinB family protein [Geothrix sp. SG198]HJV38805.1 DinB family protein [Geothrix sp.]